VKKGYKNVFAFIGGIPEWRKFNYPIFVSKEYRVIEVEKIAPQNFKKLIETDKSVYVLDVRPLKFERDSSFIIGARHCPLVFLADKYEEIPKGQLIVISDWAMKQSVSAAKFLILKGYSVLGVLKGGMERWKDSNYPVEQRVPSDTIAPLGGTQKRQGM
jgi:rhodanese-related sulfurtransferase